MDVSRYHWYGDPMARLKEGNLAQRTLCDAVNGHRLFAGSDDDRRQVTVRAVQRLAEDHLAPALRDADLVNDHLVDHCAALLAHREPGRGKSSDLLPFYLAVRGYRMLPEYIKLGVLRCLDAMVETESKMYDTLLTDDDVFNEKSDRRTARAAVPGRKREQTYQAIHDGFERAGLDRREDEEGDRGLRTYEMTNEYHRDTLRVSHEGGRYDDPLLPAKGVSALTGLAACPDAFASEWPSLSEVTEWIRQREWDNSLTVGIAVRSQQLCNFLNTMPGRPIPIGSVEVMLVVLRHLVSEIIQRDELLLAR